MSRPTAATVDHIRTSSRTIVRQLGFLRRGLAGTDLSPSAVHAIVELGNDRALRASGLRDRLGLEKSTVSRLLSGLQAKGLVAAHRATTDPRQKDLTLTPQGKKLFRAIENHARSQVSGALSRVAPHRQRLITTGLAAYADALQDKPGQPALPGVTIHSGYAPTLLARTTEMHARYYAENYGFGAVFERKVASEMAAFLGRLDSPANKTLFARLDDAIVGTLSIDGEDLGDNVAHLRWFILDDLTRGHGIGAKLLERAMAHVDAYGFAETRLWTFRGLDAARHLYEKFGFALAEEKRGTQWGTEVTEQMFIRKPHAH